MQSPTVPAPEMNIPDTAPVPAPKNHDRPPTLLDPISTLIRLGTLEFLPPHTKLSFHHNRIETQQPSLFQSTLRTISGASRFDLHRLSKPINQIPSLFPSPSADLVLIIHTALSGLEVLKESQATPTPDATLIVQTITHYQNTLKGVLRSISNPQIPQESPFLKSGTPPTEPSPISLSARIPLATAAGGGAATREPSEPSAEEEAFLVNLWDKEQITLVASIIRELQKLAADSAELHDFLKSLNGLLRQKDTRISKFLEVPVPETIESAPAPAPPKIKTPSPSPSHNSKGTVEEQSGNDDDDSPKEISRQNSITRRATELAEKNPVIVPRRRKRH